LHASAAMAFFVFGVRYVIPYRPLTPDDRPSVPGPGRRAEFTRISQPMLCSVAGRHVSRTRFAVSSRVISSPF
jgi:hypothetical protein